jgi:hypothetical protein
LLPVLADADHLPPPQRRAIEAAFGVVDESAPELFLIALATLNLLSEAAARAPLLLIVEDAHWLDRPTGDVLTFRCPPPRGRSHPHAGGDSRWLRESARCRRTTEVATRSA